MRKILITLVTAIAVFVATMIVTNLYIAKGAEEAAEYKNNMVLDHFCDNLESDILLTERSAYNFLTYLFYSTTYDSHEALTMDIEYIQHFKKHVYDNLQCFMGMNEHYESAMFVVDSAVCRKYYGMDHAYAPLINYNDTTHYEISANHDFMGSPHYAKIKSESRAFWSTPTYGSEVEGKLMSLYIPLKLDDGQFFGTFIVCIDVKLINDKLHRNLPYGEKHSQMALIDGEGKIFASYPAKLKDKGENTKYYTYERKTDYAPWTIRTICEADAIYSVAYKFRMVVMLTSIIGMLLMFISCFVVFRQISKKMRQKATAEEELKIAAKMQMSILKPMEFTSYGISVSNFIRPAIQAGGDLYDYVCKDGKFIAIIGDVSGKGMPAALFMTQVVSLFRNATRYTADPVKIATQINDSIAENNPTMTFCTAIVVCLSEGHAKVCNAGHTRPIFISAKTGKPEFLQLTPNIPLGLKGGFNYCSNELEYDSHDAIIMYTDGVTEAKSHDGEYYGESRLLDTVARNHTINGMLSSIEEFAKNTPQNDDITIVTLTIS